MHGEYLIEPKSKLLNEFKNDDEYFKFPVVWTIQQGPHSSRKESPKTFGPQVILLFLIKLSKYLNDEARSEYQRKQYKRVFGESLCFRFSDFDNFWEMTYFHFVDMNSLDHIQNQEVFADVFFGLEATDFKLLKENNDETDQTLDDLILLSNKYKNGDEHMKQVIESLLK